MPYITSLVLAAEFLQFKYLKLLANSLYILVDPSSYFSFKKGKMVQDCLEECLITKVP